VCCAAALASIDLIVGEGLAERARVNGALLHRKLATLQTRFPQIGAVTGKGLVAGVICVRPGTRTPDGDLAFDIVRRTVEKGVLMFGPVGHLGSTVKICPPLVIPPEAIEDSASAFEEAVTEAVRNT
jgi:4-aminobutyrate aminotransferase/diaminobutyrate-pyruvate transaminase/4-aminobutyrate aminotransferase/(S)-3-amino-2-methylpropionate transaminase